MEKKEKKIKRIKLLLILLFILSLLLILLIPFSKKAFIYITDKALKVLRPDNIVLSLSDIYSSELKIKVNDYVLSYFKEHSVDKLNLIDFDLEIKNNFKFIKNIEWDFSKPKIVKVNIKGKKPVCFFNKNHILSDDNDLFSINYFNDYLISFSRQFYIEQNKASDDVFAFLKLVPDFFWKKYDINYENKNSIKLFSKKNKIPIPNYFLSDQENILNDHKLNMAKKLYKKLYKNNKLFVSKKYILDLRFDNRILLRSDNKINVGRG